MKTKSIKRSKTMKTKPIKRSEVKKGTDKKSSNQKKIEQMESKELLELHNEVVRGVETVAKNSPLARDVELELIKGLQKMIDAGASKRCVIHLLEDYRESMGSMPEYLYKYYLNQIRVVYKYKKYNYLTECLNFFENYTAVPIREFMTA
jgi:hypothetical protein